MKLYWGTFREGKGWCGVAWTGKGLCALTFPQRNPSEAVRKMREYLPRKVHRWLAPGPFKAPAWIVRGVRTVFRGGAAKAPALDLFFLTPFQRRILQAVRCVPRGQVRSYAWAAAKAGSPKGSRAAGQALHRNPVPILVPCHRITAAGGGLGGFGAGLEWKRRLLGLEGTRTPVA